MNTPTPRIHEDMEPFEPLGVAELVERLTSQFADALGVPVWMPTHPGVQPQCNEVTESPGSNPENSAPITATPESERES